MDKTERQQTKVRVALVGLGNHGRTIQRSAGEASNVEVVAVYDPIDEEVDGAVDRFQCDRASSYEALLNRSDLEGLVLVTPNHLHRSQAEAALQAGLDVLVEKPIAVTIEDGLAMVRTAERLGRILMVGHNMRFARAARLARRYIDEGRLGDLASIDIHFSSESVLRLSGNAWRLHPDLCPLLPMTQLGIHAIDLVHYLDSPFDEVFAYARGVTTRGGVVDQVSAVFTTQNGLTGTIVSNYCSPTTFTYRLAGTKGQLTYTPHTLTYRGVGMNEDQKEHFDFNRHDIESYVLQMEAFGDAVRRRVPPETDGWVGLRALAVVDAMERSAANHSAVGVTSFNPTLDAAPAESDQN